MKKQIKLNYKEVKLRMKSKKLRHVDVYKKMGVTRSVFESTIYGNIQPTIEFLEKLDKILPPKPKPQLTLKDVPEHLQYLVDQP
jgi:hypothetical protein|tara:strand:+ start:409 stop:660 length:252 start_codon:yes stop_codon:yes gene_type:complete